MKDDHFLRPGTLARVSPGHALVERGIVHAGLYDKVPEFATLTKMKVLHKGQLALVVSVSLDRGGFASLVVIRVDGEVTTGWVYASNLEAA